MSKFDSVAVAIAIVIDTALRPRPYVCGTVKGDYTPATVPQNVLDAIVKDGTLFADVLNAGAKLGTGLDDQANNRGQIKNQCRSRQGRGRTMAVIGPSASLPTSAKTVSRISGRSTSPWMSGVRLARRCW
ncbi:hypothetical protein EDB92DRAFT_1814374 [Lactarius akahatsu]|uniref:Uncharacterized protein n=1 Tax=Lactarius akahatsu TaxID=416441 RepID=A0AAD4LL36_9AGAM|nr:hypothetical protein EDB92DRAFT_1814374 [Lactarius akahatsu]